MTTETRDQITTLRILQTGTTFTWNRTRNGVVDRATAEEAQAAFNLHRRYGGGVMARLVEGEGLKSVTAWPENAVEVVLLPRVAGG